MFKKIGLWVGILCASVLMCGDAYGQKLDFKAPATPARGNHYSIGTNDLLDLMPDTDCDEVSYQSLTEGGKVYDSLDRKAIMPKAAIFLAFEPGEYLVRVSGAKSVDGKGKLVVTMLSITVTGKPTPPVPPTPPGPNPPTPTPSPIAEEGFRVMILFQDKEFKKLPLEQQAVLFAKDVRTYLNDKCVTDVGAGKAYWILDVDTVIDPNVPAWVKRTYDRKRDSVPWIVISNSPNGGYEGPLPKTLEETMALLKKYGN